jgi:hypothetical protein
VLEQELPALSKSTAFAGAILSNHFMRYAIVPWSAALRNDEEDVVYARHFFRQLYGAAADSWELRLSPERAGVSRLASAVDSGLPEAVRASFAGAGISLRSIQPSLMVAYNSCRNRLEGCSAWFVLHETGSLCLALLQQGRWISARSLRTGADWSGELPLLLEREAYLVEQDVPANDVFLWSTGLDNAAMPDGGNWKLQEMQPLIHPDFVPEYDGRFAMAMGG